MLSSQGCLHQTNKLSALSVAVCVCAELRMSFAAFFAGLSSSDKYMQLDGQKSHRSRKDGKGHKKGKKKRRKGKGSESEEDVEQMHAVSTVLDAPDVRGSCVCLYFFLLVSLAVKIIGQTVSAGHSFCDLKALISSKFLVSFWQHVRTFSCILPCAVLELHFAAMSSERGDQ